MIRRSLRKIRKFSLIFGGPRVSLCVSGLTTYHYFWCSRVFLAALRVLWDVPGCFGGVPGCFEGVPGVFRGVPDVFRFLQTPESNRSCPKYSRTRLSVSHRITFDPDYCNIDFIYFFNNPLFK